MEIVFQTPTRGDEGPAPRPKIDLGRPALAFARDGWDFPIEKMELGAAEGSSSREPRPKVITPGRNEDHRSLAFERRQFRQFRSLGLQDRADPFQELDVVFPFDDDQQTRETGLRLRYGAESSPAPVENSA